MPGRADGGRGEPGHEVRAGAPGSEDDEHFDQADPDQRAVGLGAFCAAVYLTRRTGKAWPILLYAGSFFAGFYEVLLDPMARVAWPQTDTDYYGLLNQHIPLYALPMYVVYFGGAALGVWLLIDRGITYGAWCKLFPIHIVAVTAFELIPLHYDIWTYWGYQPFAIGGFPLPHRTGKRPDRTQFDQGLASDGPARSGGRPVATRAGRGLPGAGRCALTAARSGSSTGSHRRRVRRGPGSDRAGRHGSGRT